MPTRRASLVLLALSACTAPRGDGAGKPGAEDSARATDTDSAAGHDSPGPHDSPADTADSAPPGPPPLMIVVLADDLGENLTWAMPTYQDRFLPDAVQFTRAYATAPICCPCRASFLSGGFYPAATGVQANDGSNGGFPRFDDTDTLATRLQAAGVTTAIIGKYLNGYENGYAPYVPPGWDLFLVPSWLGDSTNSLLIRGASTPDAPGVGVGDDTGGEHLTGFLFEQALAFLDAHPEEPTFLLLTPQSPHVFGQPAAEDAGTWAGYQPRPPAFDEPDASDKPAWVQALSPTEEEFTYWDLDSVREMENLASLDRAIGTLLDGLADRGLLDRATVIFTSDNGLLHGEHRVADKGLPWEEAVHVPLAVRGAGLTPRADSRLVAINLDLPATVAEVFGVDDAGGGIALSEAFADASVPLRDHVFIETSTGDHPVWAGVVTDRWKYIEWGSGETELYDLDADPYELASEHAAPPADADVATFAGWVDEHRSLAITTPVLPLGTVGTPYTTTITAWGGAAPLTWTLDDGALPDGITFSADGALTGTPTAAGVYPIGVRVTDSGASPYTGDPQSVAVPLLLDIGAALRATAARDGDGARFHVPARPGARVFVRLFLDDTHDVPPIVSRPASAGPDGIASLRIGGLDATRAWHWEAVVDGIPQPGGVLRGAHDTPAFATVR
jgi:arylsulfatase A-like enzyme